LQDFADFTSWAVQRYCAPSTVEWPEAATRDPELTRIHKQQLEVG
jgi:hypothetical protein